MKKTFILLAGDDLMYLILTDTLCIQNNKYNFKNVGNLGTQLCLTILRVYLSNIIPLNCLSLLNI